MIIIIYFLRTYLYLYQLPTRYYNYINKYIKLTGVQLFNTRFLDDVAKTIISLI